MPTDIIMPRLGLTMEEGTVVRWHAAEGDPVAQGQVLLDVETDKVTVEVEAPASGVMGPVLIGAGLKVPVGTLLARLSAAGELIEEMSDGRVSAEDVRVALRKNRTPSTGPLSNGGGKRGFSSPCARRQARALGLDWREILGSGPRGRRDRARRAPHGRAIPDRRTAGGHHHR